MFEFFRKHTWLLQVVLGIVVIAFVGTGAYQGYASLTSTQNETVATVDGQKITRPEWEAAQREQIEAVRRQVPNVDPKVFDTPEMKRQSLDAVVRDRVGLAAADQLHLSTSDERLQRELMNIPQLAALKRPDGSMDLESYKLMLVSQGLTPASFENRLRQDLRTRQVFSGIQGSVIAPLASTNDALDAQFQQREIQVQRFTTKDWLEKPAPTDAEIEAFYKDPAHTAQFQAPDTASIQYVVLDVATLKKTVTVSDKDLHDYYAANEKRYTTQEERRASHILVKVDPKASADERAKAKAKAEGLLADVKKNPASFADVARKNSDDSGSAEKGGDLDFFSRDGLAAKPLADATFALKPDEIGPLVESDFGYHIVKLTGVRGGEKKPFDAVRAEMEDEIRTQQAQKKFSEAAVDFTNMVYEQPDSLKPVADKFKLEIQTAQDVHRTATPGAKGPLASTKFLDALFGNDALRNKRNTEAVEAAPSTLVSGRIVKFDAAHQLPLADVKAKVRERLVSQQAAALARKAGEARLAELRAAPAAAMPDAPLIVSRANAHELDRKLLDAVLTAPAAKLPAVIGVDLGDAGYAVAKITNVMGRDPQAMDAARAQSQYGQTWADAESKAYYAAIKARYKAEIKPGALTGPSSDAAASDASK